MAIGDGFDFVYLQAELTCLDVLIQREVQRWQAAGQEIGFPLRGLSVSDEDATTLSQLSIGGNWGQLAQIPAEDEESYRQLLDQCSKRVADLAARARAEGYEPRFEQIVRRFALNDFERGCLAICLAPALDLRYERLYGYLQDDVTRKLPSLQLALNLLTGPGTERLEQLAAAGERSPLFRAHLVRREGEGAPLGQSLQIDHGVLAWLMGNYEPAVELGDCARIAPVSDAARPQGTCLAPGDLAGTPAPILALSGPDQEARDVAARTLAAECGQALLEVDLHKVCNRGTPPLEGVRMALRDARLMGAIPYLCGWDGFLAILAGEGGKEATERVSPGVSLADVLAEMLVYPGPVITSGLAGWQADGVERSRRLRFIEFPLPNFTQRRALWEYHLSKAGYPREAGLSLDALAGQFMLPSGSIADAVATACDTAAQSGHALNTTILFEAARQHSGGRLSSLAHKIEPRYTWNDIILPEDQMAMLREIVATVRGRPLVLEQWGVGRKLVASAGIPILFSGPPGTGKTMAAEVIANELGLDLYKIDLSMVVSKYIGETEKNLEQIFGMAEMSNAILFFDEADAVFGKRSEVKDAHDRYANIEISYLLQRMEKYNGVTILATNLRANLDEAFTRRLSASIDFPFPDEGHRLRIWKTLFPSGVPRAEAIDFELLARRFKLAGGNIRNILVSAAYLAASDGGEVNMQHLLHGARREMQKMGRLVNEADMRLEEGKR